MVDESAKRQFFDIWWQSIQMMKDKKDRDEPINEGIWFIEEEE